MHCMITDGTAAKLAEETTHEQAAARLLWRARVVHLVSLMHAVALQFLRDDLSLENLPMFVNQHTQPHETLEIGPIGAPPFLISHFSCGPSHTFFECLPRRRRRLRRLCGEV